MKTIEDNIYVITYRPKDCKFEYNEQYSTSTIEEAIDMCRERNKGCFITNVRYSFTAMRKPTKTITVDI